MMLFTACSSEDIEKGTDVPKNASQIKLSFTEEDFDSDEELTRAAKPEDATQAVKDFGNNLEVEYGLERDPDHSAQDKKAATRAIANAHYTIRAYQGTTLKDEMRGTFNGNTFTPDADSKDMMGLVAGTYDFIAFNDRVTPTATGFTVTQANVETAFIGKIKNLAISGKEQKIAFQMKHVGCRVRAKINRYACNISNGFGKFYSTTDVPETVALDYMGENPVTTATRSFSQLFSIGSKYSDTPEQDARWGNEWVYSAKSDWQYFLPGTVLSNLRIDLPPFSIYKKNALAATYNIPQGVRYNLDGTTTTIDFEAESNASYSAKIRLVYTGYKYLFEDGSVGTLKSVVDPITGEPTKRKIGFVIKENNGTPHSGMAIMCTDAQRVSSNAIFEDSYANSSYSPVNSLELPAAWSEMNGYNKCYSLMTMYHQIQDINVLYAASRQDSHLYSGGNPPASFSKFYVPTLGEWKAFLDVVAFGDAGIYAQPGNRTEGLFGYNLEVDPVLASYASLAQCTKDTRTGKYSWRGASGIYNISDDFMNKSYWTCTEYGNTNGGSPFRIIFENNRINISANANSGENHYIDIQARLRAFVHF